MNYIVVESTEVKIFEIGNLLNVEILEMNVHRINVHHCINEVQMLLNQQQAFCMYGLMEQNNTVSDLFIIHIVA